jgi:RimJ/RimL family protein N-acetyltransferase
VGPIEAIELETGRLRLVVWQERHCAPYAALNADPAVMRYFPSTLTTAQTLTSVDLSRAHFAVHGWGNWAVELKESGEFIGFIGLSIPRRQLPFMPCVEIGWRLARAHWGKGYATEGARAVLRVGFERLELEEIVSFTSLVNRPSRAVMERIGMRNSLEDFDHPALAEGSDLRRHCLYRIDRHLWAQTG